MEYLSLIISALALGLSGLTAWLTLLRKGELKITQPTPLLLDYEKGFARVSFYTMIYSSAFRGQIIESMHVIVKQNNIEHQFNNWAYSQDSRAYASGCYIKPEGVPQNHQFITSEDNIVFNTGDITIEVYARLPSKTEAHLLKSIKLTIPENQQQSCRTKSLSLMLEWEPNKQIYGLRNSKNPTEIMLGLLKRINS